MSARFGGLPSKSVTVRSREYCKLPGTNLVINPSGLTALAPGVKNVEALKTRLHWPVSAPPAIKILTVCKVLDF